MLSKKNVWFSKSNFRIWSIDLAEHLATIGKPYRFAQLMSIGGFASTESQFERFRAFVSAARQRILDRQNLGNTLNPLSSAHDRIFPAFVKRFESKHPVKMSGVKTIFNPMFKVVLLFSQSTSQLIRQLDSQLVRQTA